MLKRIGSNSLITKLIGRIKIGKQVSKLVCWGERVGEDDKPLKISEDFVSLVEEVGNVGERLAGLADEIEVHAQLTCITA